MLLGIQANRCDFKGMLRAGLQVYQNCGMCCLFREIPLLSVLGALLIVVHSTMCDGPQVTMHVCEHGSCSSLMDDATLCAGEKPQGLQPANLYPHKGRYGSEGRFDCNS